MGQPKKPYDAGSLALGVDVRGRDFTADMSLDITTKNVTSGLQEGLGPRYGMAPIPGHNDTIQPALANDTAGLMRSESAADQAYVNRRKVFGVHGIVLGKIDDYPTKQKVYFWLVADSDGTFDIICSSAWDAGESQWLYEADIAGGLHAKIADRGINLATDQNFTRIVFGEFPDDVMESLLDISEDIDYVRSTLLSVSGAKLSTAWIIGNILAAGDANTPSTANFVKIDSSNAGLPSMFNTRAISTTPHTVFFYDIGLDRGFNALQWLYPVQVRDLSDALYVSSFYQDITIANYDTSMLPPTTGLPPQDGPSTFNNLSTQLVNDPSSTIDSSYTAICVATRRKPQICLIQDWQRATDGPPQQWIDPTVIACMPSAGFTFAQNTASDPYTEDANIVATAWNMWPSFVDGTPLVTHVSVPQDGDYHVTLGAANSGLLRANTVYEFAFAIFDKQFGYETNVGAQAKVQTAAADFVRISLYRDPTMDNLVGGTPSQSVPASRVPPFPAVLNESSRNINFLEFRVYYRELGTSDWLPALFIDYAKLLYYPNFGILWMCNGPVVGLPGGQPGGFNDYSPLPKDEYRDVTVFQERAFWCSTKALYWSNRQNVFSYAGRNSAACPTGEWRGVLVHVYPGQRERDATSRLLVFASEAIYTCRNTGQPVTQPVQVSPDVVLEFPLDGSDFLIEFWTSFTAFSSRASVVAEGGVYYWGPKGAFADRGEGYPVRISIDLEPKLHTMYDPNATDQTHAVYSDQTREITWFYKAKGSDGTAMSTLVYNVETRNWVFGEFNGWVDGAQQLQIDQADVLRETNGQRTVVFVRKDEDEAIQRAQYWDQRNQTGDIFPDGELMISQVATPSTGRRRLTLAAGYTPATLAAIAVNDAIAITQADDYSGLAASEILARVVATDNVGGTIDILVPRGATLPNIGPLAEKDLLPIWHSAAAAGTRGANGIEYTLPTRYWAPDGIGTNGYWIYAHWVFYVELGKRNVSLPVTIAHRTPISGGFLSYDLDIIDNSDGNYQVYLPLQNQDQGFEGQAIKFRLGGIHLGGRWVVQSLQAHRNEVTGSDWQLTFNPERQRLE